MMSKRWCELNAEERRLYNREKNAISRKRKREANPARVVIDTPKAAADREKAKRCYDRMKERDLEGALKKNRDHVRAMREKKKWTPVQHLVANAVKNVLKPYRKSDSVKKRQAYEERNRLASNLRQRIRAVLKRSVVEKRNHTLHVAGCTMAEYNAHMHAQLAPGEDMRDMSCDHIWPLAMYNLADENELRKAANLFNM